MQIGRQRPGHTELHDLDSFSSLNIQQWEAHQESQAAFQYALFFDLESQRAAHHTELCDALREPDPVSVDLAHWCRIVNFKFSLTALSPEGSLRWIGGRYNIGEDIDSARFQPFPALYVAEDFETAFREYHGLPTNDDTRGLLPEELDLEDNGSWAQLRLTGRVNNVFDVTRQANLKAVCRVFAKFTLSDRVREAERRAGRAATRLIRKPVELLESFTDPEWRVLPVIYDVPANPQVFARLLIEAGYEGVLYRSTQSGKRCLAVFTRQLANSDSRISLHPDDVPAGIQFAELSAANCNDV